MAAAIATYTAHLGTCVENFEPIAWAEELIEPARAVDHPRLAFLYVMAAQCYLAGRLEAAFRYSEDGQRFVGGGREKLRRGIGGLLVSVYAAAGQAERAVEWYRAEIARDRDTSIFTTIGLCLALATAGRPDEAMVAAKGLVDAAEATRNPLALSYAFFVVGFAFGDAEPDRAREALRRGLVIAEESGNRANESHLAAMLCRLEAAYGDTLAAFDYLTLAIRNYHDAGNVVNIRVPLAVLAAVFDRLERYEPAATIAGFAISPFTAAATPELNAAIAHLREVLGDQTYESLARKGEMMTTAAITTYAFGQIDQARAELNAVSK